MSTRTTHSRVASTFRPCDHCGAPVDPIRAPFVAHLGGAFRYYCSRGCYARRQESGAGASSNESPDTLVSSAKTEAPGGPTPQGPTIEQVADMLGIERAVLPPEVRTGASAQVSGRTAGSTSEVRGSAGYVFPEIAPAVPLVALAMVVIATTVRAALGFSPAATVLTALAAVTAMGLAGFAAWRMRRAGGGIVGWVAPLAGSVLLLGGWHAPGAGPIVRLADMTTLAATVPVVAWVVGKRMQNARRNLAALAEDLPRVAKVVRGNDEIEVIETARVRAGEVVVVEAGDRVPVDGVVRAGQGRAVLHPRGGRARSVTEGDALLAGARWVEGSVRLLATRAGDDVALARLPRLMVLEGDVPRVVRWMDRIGVVLPVVCAAVAAAGALVHAMAGGGDPWKVAAVVLAAAPCALGAALVRVPFVDAIAQAAARGIVFRDATSVEAAASVGTVVLCVRGTVTVERFELVDVVSLGSRSERELIAVAAAAEEVAGEHPIGRAMLEAARRRGVAMESVRRPVFYPGRGVTAVGAGGEMIAIGSRELLLSEGVSVAPAEEVARAIEGQRRTAVFVAIAGRVEGVLGLEDPLRDEARPAVQAMMDAGFDLALLGGDSRGTLEAIGLALDVANVRPEVPPDDRAAAVRAMAEVAHAVAVVGRPQRDGAALSAADVSISLSAAGGAGGETAVALASDDLRDAATALVLARQGRDRAVRVAMLSVVGALLSAVVHALVPSLGAVGALGAVMVLAALGYVVTRTAER